MRHSITAHRILATLVACCALAVSGCGLKVFPGDNPKPPPIPKGKAVPPGTVGRNVVRISGTSPADVAGAAILAAYTSDVAPPKGFVLVRRDRWQEALLGAQFAAKPISAAVLPIEHDFLPTASRDLVTRIQPPGFPRANGLKAVVLGSAGDDVFRVLQNEKLKLTLLKSSSPDRLSFDTVPFRGGWAGVYSSQIVVVSSEQRDYALPGAVWSAYSGDSLTYVTHDKVPAYTSKLLAQRQKLRLEKPAIYVLGPESVISKGVEQQLRAYGPVTRIAGTSPEENAVAFARYKDPKTGFGWGLDHGPASISLINTHNWGNVIGAYAFAATGPQAPLLLTDNPDSLHPAIQAYLRTLRGPRPNQGFVFGDEHSISPALLDRLDQDLGLGSVAPAGP